MTRVFRQQKTTIWGSLVGGWLIAAGITLQTFSQAPPIAPIPAPTVLKPLFGEVIESGYITVAGVTKNDTNVFVFVDGIKNGHIRVKNHPSGTASFSWQPSKPFKDGTYGVWVQAENEIGLSLPSETIEFTIRKPYPRPTMRSPVVNKTTTYVRPYLVGVARSGDTVEVMLDGVVIGKTSASAHPSGVGSFQIVPTHDLVVGWHSAHSRSISGGGITSPWSDAYVFAIAKTGAPANRAAGVAPQTSPSDQLTSIPAPTILKPAAQSFVTPSSWTIAGVVKNGYAVQIFLDDTLLVELNPKDHPSGVTAFTYRPSAKLSHGDHQIFARAVDREGRYSRLSQSVPVIIKPTVARLTLITQMGVTLWPPVSQGTIGSGVKVARTTTAQTPTTSSVEIVERPASEMTASVPQKPTSTSTVLTPEIAGPAFKNIPTIEDLESLLDDIEVTSTPLVTAPEVVDTKDEVADLKVISNLAASTTTTVTRGGIRQKISGYRPGALVLILSGLIILVGIMVTFIRDRIVAKKSKSVDFSDAGGVMTLRRDEPAPTQYTELPAVPPPPPPPPMI